MSEVTPAITVREFAQRNAISVPTVHRMIRDGELEAYRVGSQVRIRADVAEAVQYPHRRDINTVIDEIASAAPELTDEQRTTISALLRVGGNA